MSNKIHKTNAARILDQAKINYNLVTYEVDENDLSATHVAEELNQDPNQLFKTLVLKNTKNEYFVCIIPGAEELDLKKAAKVSNTKKCDLIPMKDLLEITGYIRGACSPLGMKKQFPSYIHDSCTSFDHIFISAGKRGMQIQIDPKDLLKVTKITLADLIQEKNDSQDYN